MAIVAPKERKHLSADALFRLVRSGLASLPDYRPGDTEISLSDTLMSAFAMFSLKAPSLLAFDKQRAEGNLKTIYGIAYVPCDTWMREIRDPLSPESLRPLFKSVFRQLQRAKALEPMALLDDNYLVAIRKPTSNVMPLLSSILAVMKGRTIVWSESMQHKVNMTDVDHRRTRCDTALIVLPVAPIPPMPRVCARNHPAFRQRCEAFCTLWACLHLDAPPGPMRGHPGVQRMGVVLLIRKDRHETREVLGRDVAQQEWGCHALIEPGTGDEHGEQHSQRIDQQMSLAPLDFFATVIPPLGAPHLGGLDGLTVDARATGGGLTSRCDTRAFA
jgi:hypothetical protein